MDYELIITRFQYNERDTVIELGECTLNDAIRSGMQALVNSRKDAVIVRTLQSVSKVGNRRYRVHGKIIRVQYDVNFAENAYRYIWMTDKSVRELTKSGNFKR